MSSREYHGAVQILHVWEHLSSSYRVDLVARALFDAPDDLYSQFLPLRLSFRNLAEFLADKPWHQIPHPLQGYIGYAVLILADPRAQRPLERARV